MTAWLTSARWWVVLVVSVGLIGWGLTQTLRLAASSQTLAELQRDHAAQQKADIVADAVGLVLHSRLQQDNTHAFTTNLLGLAQAEAAGAARRNADSADVQRLRGELQFLATGKAQSDVERVACRDLRDQYAKLVTLVDGGVRSVEQLRTVVGRGIEVVNRRDAEIAAALGQISVDRATLD